MKARYIPNLISIIRIILVGVFAYVFLAYYPEGTIPAVLIFIFSGITDVVDGALARHFGWTSRLGIMLDPIADKLMQCTVLLCLVLKMSGIVPWWIFAFYIVKEGLMAAGAIFLFKKRKEVYASKVFGKFATVFFYAVIAVIIIWGDDIGSFVCNLLCVLVAIAAVIALVLYAYNYMRQPDEENEPVEAGDGVQSK